MGSHAVGRNRDRRFSRTVALVLITVSSLVTQSQAQPNERVTERTYATATGLLNRGLYDLAVPEYEAFLDAFPRHDRADSARYGLAVCLERLGEVEPAVRAGAVG
jgi:TolA-binding protein